jgi:transposase
MSSREVAEIVGLSQFKVNKIRKKHFENIVMLRGGRPQALTTWEKRYAVRLVTVGGLDSAVEATRKFKSATEVDVCVETVRNALREANLGSAEKISKPALSAKHVKEMLEFAKMRKDWTVHD